MKDKNNFDRQSAREYVGGDFDNIGQWQFDEICQTPEFHNDIQFLDLACGCLRLGKLMIPYLNENRYTGIDANNELINIGLDFEITETVQKFKRPLLICNDKFEFDNIGPFEYVWANSLFSHLTIQDIKTCFKNLLPVMEPKGVFYFTYFEGLQQNPSQSHSRKDFRYQESDIVMAGLSTGWKIKRHQPVNNHPRNQKIMKATAIV